MPIGDRVYWFDMHPLLHKPERQQSEPSPNPRPVVQLLPSPRLLSSHLPYHVIPKGQDEATTCKYIYIARNPKDVVVSFYHFMQTIPEMPENGMTLDMVVEGFLQGKGKYLLCSFKHGFLVFHIGFFGGGCLKNSMKRKTDL